jgi:hypothetical protein
MRIASVPVARRSRRSNDVRCIPGSDHPRNDTTRLDRPGPQLGQRSIEVSQGVGDQLGLARIMTAGIGRIGDGRIERETGVIKEYHILASDMQKYGTRN